MMREYLILKRRVSAWFLYFDETCLNISCLRSDTRDWIHWGKIYTYIAKWHDIDKLVYARYIPNHFSTPIYALKRDRM